MKKISHNGYYLSTPYHYEDWHGGVKIERLNYKAFYFTDDGIVYKKGKKNTTEFNHEDFILNGTKGEFTFTGNMIDYVFNKGQRFEVRRQLTILDIDLLINKDQREYRWTPFPSEIKDKESTPPRLNS